ncbi:MAG: hypothetical protein NT060_04615 [Candidatus Omnitrophica bacterium]|nr:hypothetical protein [Candidatus Omnitrophota bacterium]
MNKRAASILEYSIIFVVVALVMFAMSNYIKRSFQGQVKDMADNFIGGGNEMQSADYYANAIADSNSVTNTGSNMIANDMLGGARGIDLNEIKQLSSNSLVIDTHRLLDTAPSVSASLSDASVAQSESINQASIATQAELEASAAGVASNQIANQTSSANQTSGTNQTSNASGAETSLNQALNTEMPW